MRTRALLYASLALNLVILAAWYMAAYQRPARTPLPAKRQVLYTNIVRTIRTNWMVTTSYISWKDIESSDYFTYIRNLQTVGCPEGTIRDIIVADVNQLFARRRIAEVNIPPQQWWKSEPEPEEWQESLRQLEKLEAERRRLLRELLGPNWEIDTGTDLDLRFSGPLLGTLSTDQKRLVTEAAERGRELLEASERQAREEGKELDPIQIAKLRLQTRSELSRLLNPEQLEEYLLRYSVESEGIRRSLQGMEVTPEEFRGLFRAELALDQQRAELGEVTDAQKARLGEELKRQAEEMVTAALKPETYRLYKLNQDPVFREARETARGIGSNPETVLPIYEINHLVEEERQRVLGDQALSPEEQSEQLAGIYQQQLDSMRKLLGEEAFRRYQESRLR